jgi:hypothetical protein
MANVFVEARPKGRDEGSPITDYVVEDHADHPLATLKMQKEAIEWAHKNGHTPNVARVRHLNDKKGGVPDERHRTQSHTSWAAEALSPNRSPPRLSISCGVGEFL